MSRSRTWSLDVFFAKQSMSTDSTAVRRLARTSTLIRHAGGVYPEKELHQIIGGILTLSSVWNPPLGESLVKNCGEWNEDSTRIDIGCVASLGAFDDPGDGTDVEIWSIPDKTLVWFATKLLVRLQQIGTVPQMDIARWAQVALFEL
jgi:hypothetical protein